ncbi:hypothetical protein [Streptomyces sp. NBC_00151]|uniref:hypothetical protein n=1 Tax=Streptomyces sp. NBC_00151 TaxID=2975669 RepID=UPI002DD9DDEF|nr:hypothetical protein [Streptomyces sp. NBC_00151]WRZ36924.1 hypothetical protein OG915_01870 [Streptomyces sp. NBC_00151]WRZ44652.1 hypothetical protein OG915_45695 [Streptomyces sp. NBC_00151]
MATDSTARSADPLTRGLLNRLARDRAAGPAARAASPPGLQGLPDPKTLLRLLSAWHRRGVQVGFPDLTGDQP